MGHYRRQPSEFNAILMITREKLFLNLNDELLYDIVPCQQYLGRIYSLRKGWQQVQQQRLDILGSLRQVIDSALRELLFGFPSLQLIHS